MSELTFLDYYFRWRSKYWRVKRLLFPSPADVLFMKLLGARLIKLPILSKPNRFNLIIVLSRGKILRHAKMHREVRYGKYFVDWSNDLNWIIEIDGASYHLDIVADFDREVAIREMCRYRHQDARFLRIKAARLWNDKAKTQRDIVKFLSA